jgi:hypothetical protein
MRLAEKLDWKGLITQFSDTYVPSYTRYYVLIWNDVSMKLSLPIVLTI